MVTKLSIAVAIAIGMCIGSGVARPDLQTLGAVSAFQTKIDFEQVFADVTPPDVGYVERAHKGDRLPRFRSVSAEPALLDHCEPVASPYVDPILSRIAGRCDA
jgi:hypothetical protein